MRNVVLFGDSALAMARSQLGPFLAAAAEHPRFQVAAVVDTSTRPSPGWSQRLQGRIKRGLIGACNPGSKAFLRPTPDLRSTAAAYDLSLIRPSERDINTPEFRDWVRSLPSPRVAISLGCLQIFKQDLIDCFEQTVNFHNGLLPDYRGLGATAWSLYNGEPRSGFSFHRMTAEVDAGPVLVDGSVPVDDGTFPGVLESRKLETAAKLAPRVLDAIDRNDPGRPAPAGSGSLYTGRDRRAIQRIEHPAQLTAAEIERRSRCFTELKIRLDDGWWPVTATSARGRPAIPTADGGPLGVARARFLPPWLYRVARLAGFGAP